MVEKRDNARDALYRLPQSRSGDRAPRIPLTVRVVAVNDAGKSFAGESVNISRSGVLVRFDGIAPGHFAVGQSFRLRLSPDGAYLAQQVELSAQVIREIVAPEGEPKGSRVAFAFKITF
jgi:hypothetical protein